MPITVIVAAVESQQMMHVVYVLIYKALIEWCVMNLFFFFLFFVQSLWHINFMWNVVLVLEKLLTTGETILLP